MNCRSVREELWLERDGMPSTAVEGHLRGCPACAGAAAEVKQMRSWMRELPIEEPSAQFDWRLRLRLSQAAKASEPLPSAPSRWVTRGSMQFATSMAAAAVVVLAVGLLWSRSRGPEPISTPGSQTVTTPLTQAPPVSPPSIVQVRRGSRSGDATDPALEGAAARNDSDSTRVVPQR